MKKGARNQERAIPTLLRGLCPEVQLLPFRYHFWKEKVPLVPSIDKWYPFHILSFELAHIVMCIAIAGNRSRR